MKPLVLWRSAAKNGTTLFAILIALIGVIYLAPKVFIFSGVDGLDFRLVWLAGKLWGNGENPYAPGFLDAYKAIFGNGPQSHFWVYPPYWYPIAVPLGLLPFPVANYLWKISNFGLLIAGCYLFSKVIGGDKKHLPISIFLFGLGFTCLLQATSVTISIGQTSILIFFGFSLLSFGLLKKKPLLVTSALFLLALKPNIGIVFFAVLLINPIHRWSVFKAGSLCLLSTVPLLFSSPYAMAIKSFVGNMSKYTGSGYVANEPQNLTGLTHLLDYFFSVQANSTMLVLTSMAIAVVITALTPNSREQSLFLLSLVLVVFLVPLHGYDFVLLAPLAMIVVAGPLGGRWLIISGLFLCFRAGNLAPVLGILNPDSKIFPESLLMSLALVPILLGAIWMFLQPKSPVIADDPKDATALIR